MEMVVKSIDRQGRVVIPKRWRERLLSGGRVILALKDGLTSMRPCRDVDLTSYFDSIEVKLESGLSDWRSVRIELKA